MNERKVVRRNVPMLADVYEERLADGSVVYEAKLNTRPGLNGLDEKLAKYLGFRNGFFVEAGGNDGFAQSNTYFLEKVLGWRGILIEGIPDLYKRCVALRNDSKVFHCALVSPQFEGDRVTMHYANLMSVVDRAMKSESATRKHIEAGLACQRLPGTYSVEVPARTLNSVLRSVAPKQIDFLSLDVEGCEAAVLEGLDMAEYHPTYILVEARFYEEVDSLLAPHYEQVEQLTHHDFLYRYRGATQTAGVRKGGS